MTGRASDFLRWIIAMRLLESLVAGRVTTEAQSLFLLHEKPRLVGAMGSVTGGASRSLEDFVHICLLVVFFLVALVADFVPFGIQQVVGLGCVWIVAAGASSSLCSVVNIRLVESYPFLVVTGIAKLVPFFF